MVSGRLPLPLVMSVVTSVVSSVVTEQEDRMPTMDHTMDLMSYTCGETVQAKQFNFVSPGLLGPAWSTLIGRGFALIGWILFIVLLCQLSYARKTQLKAKCPLAFRCVFMA